VKVSDISWYKKDITLWTSISSAMLFCVNWCLVSSQHRILHTISPPPSGSTSPRRWTGKQLLIFWTYFNFPKCQQLLTWVNMVHHQRIQQKPLTLNITSCCSS